MAHRASSVLCLTTVAVVFAANLNGVIALAKDPVVGSYQLQGGMTGLPGRPDSVKFAVLGGSGDESELSLRRMLEPLLVRHNVSVVLTGRDPFYERVKPQNGIVYFVVGSGGELGRGTNAVDSRMTARRYDSDQAFLAVEIIGNQMFFNAISREGSIVDSGILTPRRTEASTALRW
jgi:hypothetical protein